MQIHSEPHSTSTFKKYIGWKILLLSILFVSLGFLNTQLFLGDYKTWYSQLNKPFFNPSSAILAPIWTFVYILMACSAAIIWQIIVKSKYPIVKKYAKGGLVLFAIHLIFNYGWTPIFFYFKLPILSILIILILFGYILFLIRYFKRIGRLAAYLLIPYAVWIFYAACLNIAIVLMN